MKITVPAKDISERAIIRFSIATADYGEGICHISHSSGSLIFEFTNANTGLKMYRVLIADIVAALLEVEQLAGKDVNENA